MEMLSLETDILVKYYFKNYNESCKRSRLF